MSIEKFNSPPLPDQEPERDEEMLQRIIKAVPEAPLGLARQPLPKELNPGAPRHGIFNDPRKMPDPTIPDPAVSPESAYPSAPPENLK